MLENYSAKKRGPLEYDKKDIPKVTNSPLRMRKDYCAPVEEPPETVGVLVCPGCGREAPFNLVPPPGVAFRNRTLKCSCGENVFFPSINRCASDGKYRVL